MTTMNDRIEQIEARAKAASEGPWGTLVDTYRTVPMHRIGADISGDDVAQVIYHGAQESSNAAFIANAREDVPYLLALVREQQAQIERVKAACDRIITNADGHKPPGPPNPTREQATAARIRAALTATEGA